jgi:hypothetical protein
MQASVGRIVHYVPLGWTECLAAIVTRVNPEGSLMLKVFWPVGVMHVPDSWLISVPQDEEHAVNVAGTWHWPERV